MKSKVWVLGLFLIIFLIILSCRMGIRSASIPWPQCVVQEDCNMNVAVVLEYLYRDEGAWPSFFANYKALWIWKAFHPGFCTAFTGPLPQELESDWEPPPNGVRVITWSFFPPTTIYWKGGTGANIWIRERLFPRDFPLRGCYFWASADAAFPDVHYQSTFGLKWYGPESVAIRSLHWVCELWYADEDRVSEDVVEAQRLQEEEIEQLLERTTFQPSPEDLARLCDWYLWCNEDMSTCRTGGRRVRFQMPNQEAPK